METARQPAHLAFFIGIEGWASGEQLGHGAPPGPRLPA